MHYVLPAGFAPSYSYAVGNFLSTYRTPTNGCVILPYDAYQRQFNINVCRQFGGDYYKPTTPMSVGNRQTTPPDFHIWH